MAFAPGGGGAFSYYYYFEFGTDERNWQYPDMVVIDQDYKNREVRETEKPQSACLRQSNTVFQQLESKSGRSTAATDTCSGRQADIPALLLTG